MRAVKGDGGSIESPAWNRGALGKLRHQPNPLVGKTNTNCPLNFSHEFSSGIKYTVKVPAAQVEAGRLNRVVSFVSPAKQRFDFVPVSLNLGSDSRLGSQD